MPNSISINNDYKKISTNRNMNFSQTYNLLSKFVKEKGSLKFPNNLDSHHGGSSEEKNGSTMNLFPVNEDDHINVNVGHTINLFPQFSGFNSSVEKRASPEPAARQMTIFYGGQVAVFNGLPSDKAKEVMNLASSFESTLKKRKVETPANPVPVPIPSQNPCPNPNPCVKQNLFPNLNPTPSLSHRQNSPPSNVIPAAAASVLPRPLISKADLPIARKASLHRFLEKRKDRLVSKAPASTNVSNGSETKAVEVSAWLGLNSLLAFEQKHQ